MIRHTTAAHKLWEADPGRATRSSRLADDLERLIVAEGPGTIAAFIGEPCREPAGDRPADTYWARIQEVLRAYDILLICDEVISGFGRLGQWFGAEVFGIEPDLVTVAKGITSAYVPLSGCLVSEKVWSVLLEGSSRLGLRARLHLHRAPARSRGGAREPGRARERRADRTVRLARHAPAPPSARGVRRVTRSSARCEARPDRRREFVAERDPPTPFDPG
jgi:L-2,4-diaminobutyrate transaminase